MLIKFNSLIKMATCMLAKKFTEHNESQEGEEDKGVAKSRASGQGSKLDDKITEEIEDEEVMNNLWDA